jgi:hypothetical protein
VTYLYLAGALGGLALVIAVWFYRRRALGAEKERDRATADLAAAETAAAQERERQQGAFHAIDSFGDQYQAAVEAMVRAHPDLVGEYTALVLRLASGSPGAGVASLPITGATRSVS